VKRNAELEFNVALNAVMIYVTTSGLDCAVFYVPPTQYRLYGRVGDDGFYRSKDPTNSIKVTY